MTHADETSFLPAAAVYMHKGESCGCAEGELVVTPACSERLRGYNLYWGSRAGERLANYTKITELNSPGPEEIRYRFPAALLVPEGAEALLLFPSASSRSGCDRNYVYGRRHKSRLSRRMGTVFRSLDGSAGAGPSAHAFRCRKPRHAFLQIPRRAWLSDKLRGAEGGFFKIYAYGFRNVLPFFGNRRKLFYFPGPGPFREFGGK